MEEFETLRIWSHGLSVEDSWRLLEWWLEKGADEFTLRWDDSGGDSNTARQQLTAFESAMGEFRKGTAERSLLAPGDERAGDDEGAPGPVELWRLEPGSIERLREMLPEGLFTYDPGVSASLEDLQVYRNGLPMLGVSSARREGLLRVAPYEILALEMMGIFGG